ncbi:MAG: HIT family protein [Clostridia bacterium]
MNENQLTGNSKSAIDFLGKEWKYDCMGCAIAKHALIPPGGLIYEDKNFTLQQDPEIPIKGFLIINIKRHVHSITELSEEERNALGQLLTTAVNALKNLNITNEVTIIQEERSKHYHVWIFPTHSWMEEKIGKGVFHLKEMCEYAKKNASDEEKMEIVETVEKLKKEFKNSY